MSQLIAGCALTTASDFFAVVLDSCRESLCIKQRSSEGLSLDMAEQPGGYRHNAASNFNKPLKHF